MRLKPDEHAPERKKRMGLLKWVFALILCMSVAFIIRDMKTFDAVYLKTSGFDLILDAPNPKAPTNSNETLPPPAQPKAEGSTAVTEATNLNNTKNAPPPPSTTEQKQGQNPFGHFLMHIPKSGTSHAFSQINDMSWTNTDDPQFGKTRPCNEATKPLRNFARFRKSYKGTNCTLWMTEQPFSTTPEHVYAMLRNPHSHTLSLYFHCRESKDHKSLAHRMPSLDNWLKGWVDAKRNANSSLSIIEEQARLGGEWSCYNPINIQTRWIGHPSINTQKMSHGLFYASLSDHYQVSQKDLRERYIVLGDQAQMDKSVCMIYTHWRGYVAEQCDCTNATEKNVVAEGDGSNVAKYLNQSTKVIDHGVTHHGDTFKTTPEQDAMIAFLRDRDIVLYEETQKIFAEQVRQTEEKYGVKICDEMKPTTNS